MWKVSKTGRCIQINITLSISSADDTCDLPLMWDDNNYVSDISTLTPVFPDHGGDKAYPESPICYSSYPLSDPWHQVTEREDQTEISWS